MIFISENKSINQNAIANIISMVLLNGINFFAIPLYTRLLGAANYGVVSVYNAWVLLVGVVVGLQAYSTIGQARLHFSAQEFPKYLSSLVCLGGAGFFFFLALSFIFLKPLSAYLGQSYLLTVLIVIQAFGNFGVSFATTMFSFSKQPLKTLAVSVFSVMLSLGLSVWWISSAQTDTEKISGAIWGKALPPIVLGFGFLLYFLLKGRCVFKKEYLTFSLPICLPLILHSLSHNVLSQCDKIMLQGQVSEQQVGIYSFFVTFSHLLNSLWSALNNTWVPFYYDDMKGGRTKQIAQRFRNYMEFFGILVLGFLLLSPEVVRLFSTSEYWSGMYLIPIMCGSMYLIFLYSFPVNFQLYYRSTKMIAIGTSGAAALNIALNASFIPLWGMAGAAGATFLSYMALFLFHHFIASHSRKGKYTYPLSLFFKGSVIFIVGAIIFYIFQDLWLIRWISGAALGLFILLKIIKRHSLF